MNNACVVKLNLNKHHFQLIEFFLVELLFHSFIFPLVEKRFTTLK